MTTPEEKIAYWKARCAHVEKELKHVTADLLAAQANCDMWKRRAEQAEQMIKDINS